MQPPLTYNEKDHTYHFGDRRIVGITDAMSRAGLTPPIPEAAKRNFEAAGVKGSTAHSMCELYDLGVAGDYEMDPTMQGYLDAWVAFRSEWAYHPEMVEVPMGHPIYQFGGTPDTAGPIHYPSLGFKHAIVERKTCDLADHVGFQLAGQELLVQHEMGERWPGPCLLLAVRLNKDGTFQVKGHRPGEYTQKRAYYRGLFLAAVAVSNYQISQGR